MRSSVTTAQVRTPGPHQQLSGKRVLALQAPSRHCTVTAQPRRRLSGGGGHQGGGGQGTWAGGIQLTGFHHQKPFQPLPR